MERIIKKMNVPNLSSEKTKILNNGVVIPALPLALNSARKLDDQRQRTLLRYYLDAGAGGIAVAVHTTQFEIRNPDIALFEPLLKIAAEEISVYTQRTGKHILKIAGIVGETSQAESEATLIASLAYDAGLLSLSALPEASNSKLISHCRAVARHIPLIGFYLQPAVGGRKLDVDFWREFASIENVVAIKMAPFNRYQTLDVIRGVAESGRAESIALYTGNDDNIVADLLTEFRIQTKDGIVKKRMVGGLLGHWAVWTRKAVELLDRVHNAKAEEIQELLSLGVRITDSNAAFFDAANSFEGVIAGIHEVLFRQGLLKGTWLLNQEEKLSPGQIEEIDRVYHDYPDLNDDVFVKENLSNWLS
jgi:dihydrodipicolinate synthase/N-acetylneuraminate lyase